MKNIFIAICLLVCMLHFSGIVHADTISVLQQRLNKVTSFYADFHQKVKDRQNSILQEGDGHLWVERPNHFYWYLSEPNENIVISDGKTIWHYTPCMEQVSIYSMQQVIHRTPFILISCNDLRYWRQYHILKQGDNFCFTPKSLFNNLQTFSINVSQSGIINTLSIVEQDGICIKYVLNKQKIHAVSSDKFRFIIPDGVTVDDQR
ncbi:outer membrane lipoprotein chaperone LolA [Candidatus Erwinia haradaeae]|uniref:Outer-membrane lipoprotein carrier protein n=1 Tax=Candidatus Erwinia haradaeae TaxID=1922217 RepID=A0A451D9I0_9GAMM|nr:outer membrane lipoprotein chaperone LolA [Candidatus Erwinia haradaeae]VFP82923.1 Outer-membrane lipoprotein carrier protein [Candidatus Erwinia haradaeae]